MLQLCERSLVEGQGKAKSFSARQNRQLRLEMTGGKGKTSSSMVGAALAVRLREPSGCHWARRLISSRTWSQRERAS